MERKILDKLKLSLTILITLWYYIESSMILIDSLNVTILHDNTFSSMNEWRKSQMYFTPNIYYNQISGPYQTLRICPASIPENVTAAVTVISSFLFEKHYNNIFSRGNLLPQILFGENCCFELDETKIKRHTYIWWRSQNIADTSFQYSWISNGNLLIIIFKRILEFKARILEYKS